ISLPLLLAKEDGATAEKKVELPAYDYQAWREWAVLDHGRIKPFESAAAETVRYITGKEHFQKQDPVALVLQWKLLKGTNAGVGKVEWDNYPFILCNQPDLRRELFKDVKARAEKNNAPVPDESWIHGTHIAPADLIESPKFQELCKDVAKLREEDGEKAQHRMSPAQREAEEVEQRLSTYYSITQ